MLRREFARAELFHGVFFLHGERRVKAIAARNGGGFQFSRGCCGVLAELAVDGRTHLPVGFMAFA